MGGNVLFTWDWGGRLRRNVVLMRPGRGRWGWNVCSSRNRNKSLVGEECIVYRGPGEGD